MRVSPLVADEVSAAEVSELFVRNSPRIVTAVSISQLSIKQAH